MSYCRTTNLKDRLVRNEISVKPETRQSFLTRPRMGMFSCLSCTNCKLMHKGATFVYPRTNVSFKIQHFLTCSSSWIIYKILTFPFWFLCILDRYRTWTLVSLYNCHGFLDIIMITQCRTQWWKFSLIIGRD